MQQSFAQTLRNFCQLTIQKIDLEAKKAIFADKKDYKSAAKIRKEIKPLDNQLQQIVTIVKVEVDKSNVNQFNYCQYHHKIAFLEQFKTTNYDFEAWNNNEIIEIQKSRKFLLQNKDFQNAAIMSELIQIQKKLAATPICNYWNIKL